MDKDREIKVLRRALDIAAHETEKKMSGLPSFVREAARVNAWVIKGTEQVKKEDEERACLNSESSTSTR